MTSLTADITTGSDRAGSGAGNDGVAPGRARRPSLGRLTLVELRKMTDTRSGFWLLLVVALLAAGMVALQMFTGNGAGRTFTGMFRGTLMPVSVLLPVLGIMSVTSEWSQRTAVTTFTLVPGRGRIVVVKVLAGIILAALAAVMCLAAAAIGNLLVGPLVGGSGTWEITATTIGYGFLYLLFGMLMGTAFGMLFMNTPLAIVLYFLIPSVWSVLGQFVGALGDVRQWIDQSVTMVALTGSEISGEAWAQIAATAGVWVLLPLAIGFVRLMRREVS